MKVDNNIYNCNNICFTELKNGTIIEIQGDINGKEYDKNENILIICNDIDYKYKSYNIFLVAISLGGTLWNSRYSRRFEYKILKYPHK